MHKEIHNDKRNLFTVALNFSARTLPHHVVQCIFYRCTLNEIKKGKLKHTSNMRSQKKVIQVRCVKIKLKVNNNNSNNSNNSNNDIIIINDGRRDRRSAGKTNIEKELIYSVVLLVAPPLSCWAVCLVLSVISPFSPLAIWIGDRRGNAVTCSDAH